MSLRYNVTAKKNSRIFYYSFNFFILLLLLGLSGCSGSDANSLSESDGEEQTADQLVIYCAAGIREAVEEAVAIYRPPAGSGEVSFQLVFNSTGRLLAQLELSKAGDLFISSEDDFMEQALDKGLLEQWKPVGTFVPAIIVASDNPKEISSLADLVRPDTRVIICDQSAAMGRAAEEILHESNLYQEIMKNVVNRPATAPQVVLDIALDQGDAGITGRNSTGEMADRVMVIEIPSEQNRPTQISAAVLNSSQNHQTASAFIDFLASAEGEAIFLKHGFGSP